MHNILIVTETQSYLVTSLQTKLEELGYSVHIVSADTDKISKIEERLSAILIYGDESLMEKQQALIYIKDKAPCKQAGRSRG